jgi:hypothetical protein
MSLIEREQVIEAVAARLPGAVTRARASNVLHALDEAGYAVVPAADWRGAVGEIVWLRAALGRIAAGHAHAPKLAGEAVDESETRLPLGGQ